MSDTIREVGKDPELEEDNFRTEKGVKGFENAIVPTKEGVMVEVLSVVTPNRKKILTSPQNAAASRERDRNAQRRAEAISEAMNEPITSSLKTTQKSSTTTTEAMGEYFERLDSHKQSVGGDKVGPHEGQSNSAQSERTFLAGDSSRRGSYEDVQIE
ncbi:MAG: hypothetical protein M1827_005592 [Pycnora praestabilis]|nr:MAG: hypothetical protein M1827_005592 [Pycnora praestabilis]